MRVALSDLAGRWLDSHFDVFSMCRSASSSCQCSITSARYSEPIRIVAAIDRFATTQWEATRPSCRTLCYERGIIGAWRIIEDVLQMLGLAKCFCVPQE